jgi:hypothetical protein
MNRWVEISSEERSTARTYVLPGVESSPPFHLEWWPSNIRAAGDAEVSFDVLTEAWGEICLKLPQRRIR